MACVAGTVALADSTLVLLIIPPRLKLGAKSGREMNYIRKFICLSFRLNTGIITNNS